MTLLFKQRGLGDTPNQLIPSRYSNLRTGLPVSADDAMRHSAVWACIRLRADLVSTMPVNAYRMVDSIQAPTTSTQFLLNPDNRKYGIQDWLYRSQVDLDRAGNDFGIIRVRDGLGLPALVELAAPAKVVIYGNGPDITRYRIDNVEYSPLDVWHERQFAVSGIPVGLSPIGYAAMSLNTYLSAAEFALEWFNGAAFAPPGHLKNVDRVLQPGVADKAKLDFKAAVANRDLFVSGKDWEYTVLNESAAQAQFLDAMKASISDVCRYLGVPGDMIDAETSTGSITYANITQRNLQFLITNLGPALARREFALSQALPKPRFVKFDESALLRMDPQTRATVFGTLIAARTIAPDEARAQMNMPPMTEAQMEQLERLFTIRRIAETVQAGSTPESLATEGANA